MNKILTIFLVIVVLVVSGCTSTPAETTNEDNTQETQEKTGAMDVDSDGDNDVSVTTDGKTSEVTVEMDDVRTTPKTVVENYCVPGSKYSYSEDKASSDSTVIGLTQYKGKEFCKAESKTEIDSPIGKIVANTVYYFDNTQSEFWVIVTTNTPGMPAQTTETHIVDGEVQ